MGLVRFMTVYDDEENCVLSLKRCNKFDISATSSFFRSDGNSYLDNFNVNSRDFYKMKDAGADISVPTIPHAVFQYSLERLRDWGYLASFVVCPHGKWLPYYKEAVHAVANINRTAKRNNDEYFHSYVINSKAFGIGSVLLANTLAVDFYHNRNSTTILKDYSARYASSSTTYILTKNDTIFGSANDYKAYRISDTRVFPVDIGNSVEAVRFDRFTEIVGKAIMRHNGRYAVSFGCRCDFAGNVIGRIIQRYKHDSLVSAQYGIVTAQLFGTRTLCIHLGEYI